jgi:hypothetical protein
MMRLDQQQLWALAAWALAAMALCGCGGEPGGGTTGPPAKEQPAESTIKRRTADKLPAVGDYLPPLDDGKIELAPPAKWNTMPRDARYLARFVAGKASELPRITVTAWDSPLVEVADLDESNAGLLTGQLIKEMKRDKKTVVEMPKPIYLGETLFVRHVRRAKMPSGDNVVVQGLDTIRAGRIYTIELIALIDSPRAEEYEASLTKYRDEAYAVAANLKFDGASTPSTTEAPAAVTPAETPPAEKPADNAVEANPKP